MVSVSEVLRGDIYTLPQSKFKYPNIVTCIGGLMARKRESKGRDERRSFSQAEKNEVLTRQKGICALCNQPLDVVATHFDPIRPWNKEGKTEAKEIRALCASCHAKKLA
jgi:5-methylcytosine-specific restriction endonuclease McrA